MICKPRERVSAAQSIVNQMLDMTRDRSLQPGDQSPPELSLTARLSVGRSFIREALQLLSSSNVITFTPGSGAFVNIPQASEVFLANLIGFLVGNSMSRELIDPREMFKLSGAILACLRGTPNDFDRISNLLAKHEPALEQGEASNEFAAAHHLSRPGLRY